MRSANRADQKLGGYLERFWAGEGRGGEGAAGGRCAVVEGQSVEGDGWDEVEVWGNEIEEAEEVGLSILLKTHHISPSVGKGSKSAQLFAWWEPRGYLFEDRRVGRPRTKGITGYHRVL